MRGAIMENKLRKFKVVCEIELYAVNECHAKGAIQEALMECDPHLVGIEDVEEIK